MHVTAMRLALGAVIFPAIAATTLLRRQVCNSVENGYECEPEVSHYWGQYSPYFKVPSEINAAVPEQCEITFVNMLSRHGARSPTSSKSTSYNDTINKIKSTASSYDGPFAFLATYEYTLGADELTEFGESQLYDSGVNFFDQYQSLAEASSPFIRASGESRVVASAKNFVLGFNSAAGCCDAVVDVIISEAEGSNNTLDHGLCDVFEDGPDSDLGKYAQGNFSKTFVPAIQARVHDNLPGTNLSSSEIINLMDLCPFETVAAVDAEPLSPFCALFATDEWRSYDYYQTLGKYYGYGDGNPLGPTNGVGYTNELIARLTSTPVNDSTSTNRTLDSSDLTFPLGRTLYADFSHDNDMIGIFAVMGLHDITNPLSTEKIESPEETDGFTAAWTVSFAARMFVEKMTCDGVEGELVRVLVNGRVIDLHGCDADEFGRCTLEAFVESLGFAKSGGNWDQCFD